MEPKGVDGRGDGGDELGLLEVVAGHVEEGPPDGDGDKGDEHAGDGGEDGAGGPVGVDGEGAVAELAEDDAALRRDVEDHAGHGEDVEDHLGHEEARADPLGVAEVVKGEAVDDAHDDLGHEELDALVLVDGEDVEDALAEDEELLDLGDGVVGDEGRGGDGLERGLVLEL